jgi:ABC-type uncharacterized transport system permease subunit
MNLISANTFLYVAIALYGVAAVAVLIALIRKVERPPAFAFGLALIALVSHTIFIGTICSRTGHPPLTNLPEAATFIAWVVMVIQVVLLFRYRIQAASFFVYPLVLLLLTVAAVITDPLDPLPAEQSSKLFTVHILLASVGVAALLLALAFGFLYNIQERAIKDKKRGPFYDWIPNLKVCDLVSYRALAVGFAIYTGGILTGILWSHQQTSAPQTLGAKEIGAAVAWAFFALLLQNHISGSFRSRKTVVLAVLAFVSILVALFGIQTT